jgi:predicted hydrocarbon binding protein
MIEETFALRFITWANLEASLIRELSFYTNPVLAVRVLFNVGETCGRRSFTRITSREPPPSPSAVLARIRQVKAEERWGRIDFTGFHLDESRGRIVVADSFEAKARTGDVVVCHFLKGYLTGFLSGLSSQTLVIEETTCAARGDANCVFDVSPAS